MRIDDAPEVNGHEQTSDLDSHVDHDRGDREGCHIRQENSIANDQKDGQEDLKCIHDQAGKHEVGPLLVYTHDHQAVDSQVDDSENESRDGEVGDDLASFDPGDGINDAVESLLLCLVQWNRGWFLLSLLDDVLKVVQNLIDKLLAGRGDQTGVHEDTEDAIDDSEHGQDEGAGPDGEAAAVLHFN